MENLLEIKNLKVDFFVNKKLVPVIDGVSFCINKDEVLVLAGESGSGKTLSALSITKILPHNAIITSGSIKFSGSDLLVMDEKQLVDIRGREIAYIFQEPTSYLNPVFTIGDQITEVIMLHQNKNKESAIEEAKELLSLVKIKEPKRVLFDYPHQLSGGMNQRVFLAMALACRPRLLIADEPTTALDVTIEAQILQLLLELKKTMGFSLLFITHNLSIAKRIANRICIMHKGKIVEEGSVEKIFDAPEHFHTRELINAYEKIGKL
ncbi:MAG: ABC transporter ATP-binding protein [Candidatus Omnitrophica bacterium]|nr:ABC transporter ATP-binding protein [Candidatus Omnitrophota bacterium]